MVLVNIRWLKAFTFGTWNWCTNACHTWWQRWDWLSSTTPSCEQCDAGEEKGQRVKINVLHRCLLVVLCIEICMIRPPLFDYQLNRKELVSYCSKIHGKVHCTSENMSLMVSWFFQSFNSYHQSWTKPGSQSQKWKSVLNNEQKNKNVPHSLPRKNSVNVESRYVPH